MPALADMRDAGGAQGARRILAPRHAQAARAGVGRVDEGAVALLRPEQLVGDRLVDDASDDLTLALQADRDGEVRYAVQKVRGAVERVDDPAVAAVALALAALFAEEAVFRPRACEFGAQRALGLDVGVADEIAGAFLGDLQLLDLAEGALRVLGGGEGSAFIERDHGFHAVLQEAGLVGVENVGADGELLEGLLVHERVAVFVLEQVGAVALVDMDPFDGLAGAEALLQLVALAQRLALDGDERAALARADMLDLGGPPELAVVFDDVAGTDGIDGHFHGITGAYHWIG